MSIDLEEFTQSISTAPVKDVQKLDIEKQKQFNLDEFTDNISTDSSPVKSINSNFAKMDEKTKSLYLKQSEGKPIDEQALISEKLVQNASGTPGVARSTLNTFLRSTTSAFTGIPKSIGILESRLFPTDDVTGSPVKAEDTLSYKMGEWVDNKAKEMFPTNPEYQDQWKTKIAQGFGSGAGYIMGGLLGKGLKLSTTAVSAILGAGDVASGEYKNALVKTNDPDKAFETFKLNLPVGATEAIPIGLMFNKLNKLSGGMVKQLLVRGTVGGVEELIQETTQQTATNFIAKKQYDKMRDLREGVAEGGAVGFLVGAVFNTMGVSLKQRKMQLETEISSTKEDTLTPDSAKQEAAKELEVVKEELKAIEKSQKALAGRGDEIVHPLDLGVTNETVLSSEEKQVKHLEEVGFSREKATEMVQESVLKQAKAEIDTILKTTAIQQQIKETTGQKDLSKKLQVSEKSALRTKLKAEQKASKEGFREGKAVVREPLPGDVSSIVRVIDKVDRLINRIETKPVSVLVRQARVRKAASLLDAMRPEKLSSMVRNNQISVDEVAKVEEVFNTLPNKPSEQEILTATETVAAIINDAIELKAVQEEAYQYNLTTNSVIISDQIKGIKTPFGIKTYSSLELAKDPKKQLQQLHSQMRLFTMDHEALLGEMSGGVWEGPLYEELGERLFKAGRKRSAWKNARMDKVAPVIQEHLPANANDIRTIAGVEGTYGELMYIALASENENSSYRLINGNKLTQEQLNVIHDSFINDPIFKIIKDVYNTDFDEIATVVKQVDNKILEKQEGYVPHQDQDSEYDSGEILLQGMEKEGEKISDSFTKHRVKTDKPLKIQDSIQSLFSHIHNVSRYIAFAPEVKYTRDLVNAISPELKNKFGEDTVNALKGNLDQIQYGDKGFKLKGEGKLASWARNFRERAVAAVLSPNVKTWLNQYLTLPNIAAEVGWSRTLQAMKMVHQNPRKAIDLARSMSEDFKSRSIDFAVADAHQRLKYSSEKYAAKQSATLAKVAEELIRPVSAIDAANAAVAFFAGAGTDINNLNIEEGNKVLRATQTMTQDEYRSPIQRGSEVNKIAGTFISQTSRLANQSWKFIAQYENGKISKEELTKKLTYTIFVPSVFAALIQAMFRSEDRDPEEFIKNTVQNSLQVSEPLLGVIMNYVEFKDPIAIKIPKAGGSAVIKLAEGDVLGGLDKALEAFFLYNRINYPLGKNFLKFSAENIESILDEINNPGVIQ